MLKNKKFLDFIKSMKFRLMIIDLSKYHTGVGGKTV